MYTVKSVCFMVLVFAVLTDCILVVLQRSYVSHLDTNYVDYAFSNISRSGRKNKYVANVEIHNKYLAGNNVTMHLYINEKVGNTYKRSLVDFHYKLCDFFKNEPYFGKLLANSGFGPCPFAAGTIRILNITPIDVYFPNLFPYEEGRVDFFFNKTSTGEALLGISTYLLFKNKVKGKQGIIPDQMEDQGSRQQLDMYSRRPGYVRVFGRGLYPAVDCRDNNRFVLK